VALQAIVVVIVIIFADLILLLPELLKDEDRHY